MKPPSPSASCRSRHCHTMAVPSWLIPFFPPQKRPIASFFQSVNVGTGTDPPSLVPLGRRKSSSSTSTDTAFPDNGTFSWTCPAVSPRSAGLACPVALYGDKTVLPRRSEGRIIPRRRHHAPNSGPNHRRSLRRQQRRTPQPELATRVLFKRPKQLRRLIKWPLPGHLFLPTVSDRNGPI